MPDYKQIAIALKEARKIVVLTGAGMSTASGLSDYRSHGGLWDGRDPFEISHASKVGTQEFINFFAARVSDVKQHKPNEGHLLLEKWKESLNMKIITQNIDGYHGKDAIEMHGHLRDFVCEACGETHSRFHYAMFRNDKCLNPKCKDGHVRPRVVLFGENIDFIKHAEAMGEMLMADVVLVIGTSLEVAPFNELLDIAFTNRARTIVITKSDTPFDGRFSFRSYDDITTALKEIDSHL